MQKCTSKLSCGSSCEACAIYSPIHYQSAVYAGCDAGLGIGEDEGGRLTEQPQPVTFRGTFAFDHVFYSDSRVEITPGGVYVFGNGKRSKSTCYEVEDIENIHIVPENNKEFKVVALKKPGFFLRFTWHRKFFARVPRRKKQDTYANLLLEVASHGTVGVLVDSPKHVKEAIIEAISIQY